MIRPFNFYIESRKVVKQKPENNVAISLLKKAKERFGYIETQEIKDGNSFIIFENLYESLREATQSLLAIEGYKPYSHEAIIAFLKERVEGITEDQIELFNDARIKRHDSLYYGKEISKEKTMDLLNLTKLLLPVIEKELNKRFKK